MLARARIAAVAVVMAAVPLASQAVAADAVSVRVLTDKAGDANGLVAVTDAPATAPASIDSADLRHVDIKRVGDALQVRFGLTALPNVSGDSAQTFYRLSATLGGCRFYLGAIIGTLTPTTPAPGVQAFFDSVTGCPNGDEIIRAEPSWTGTTDAASRELVLTFPLESLPKYIPGLAPGATLTGVSADSAVGTYVLTGGTSTAEYERYTTAVLDAAPGGLSYAVPCTTNEC